MKNRFGGSWEGQVQSRHITFEVPIGHPINISVRLLDT